MQSSSLELASDATLVVAIGRWRQEALAEAYRRHAGAVLALARRILGERTLAEEVVQEVFLRLWYQADKFDPERGSLRSYLLSHAHGRSIDLLRSEASRRHREEREAAATIQDTNHVEDEVTDKAVAAQVRDALSVLPDTERRAIELAYFGGHTYQEVAVLLHEPEGTVKSRIRAGLRRLRTALADVVAGEGWDTT